MSDARRGADAAFSAALKVAEPGRRPRHHRGSVRRDRAQADFITLTDALELPPWARERLRSSAFLGRARAEDYELLAIMLQAAGVK